MHRIDGPGATVDNKFTEGDPAAATPATTVTDDWLNDLQENVCKVIEDAGIALSKGSDSQLKTAIANMIANSSLDLLNTTRVNVTSAATVNLTAAAPSSRHINITGTTAISAFTIAAGKCYFVRFDASLTLTNGASLVTQSGANITTAAGDTCLLRATAANAVEVLCYTRASTGTWQNMFASRLPATNYTNPYSHDIEIAVVTGDSSGNSAGLSVLINGQAVFSPLGGASSGALPRVGVTITIPAFSTYRVEIDGLDTLRTWWEKRP